MSKFLLKENSLLKEKYYYTKLPRGLNITVIPKEMSNKFAFICCDFGNGDLEYDREGKRYKLPSGTAHFLEHKMFETENGSDAFLEFDNFGGNANAFTSLENTCYYFSCTENFFDNLKILLSAVSSFHCTEESVDRERKIIAREIMMYEDMPTSVMNRNLYKSMYHAHPCIHSISGTVDSISQITKETLEQAFNHFYCPDNLTLCVCGDVDKEKVLETAMEFFPENGGKRPKTVYPNEPFEVKTKKTVAEGVVAVPLFSIGIKCPPFPKNDLEAFRKGTAIRLAVSLIFGRASDFYCDNYKKGLLNERFYAGFAQTKNNGHVVISGSGRDADEILRLAKEEIEKRKAEFFTEEQFLREKKAAYAESITLFDSAEDLTSAMAVCGSLDYDEFDCIEALRDISLDEVREALASIDTDNASVSIIN